MKNVLKSLALAAALVFAGQAAAVQLETQNVDAVKLGKSPFWNAKAGKASNTVWRLTAKDGTALGGLNYALIDIGGTSYKISTPLTLTETACATNWGSSGTHNAYLYASVHGNTPQLCVSDAPNLATVGAVSAGASGYVQCNGTSSSTDAVRQIGLASLNCTGPVIGTVSDTAAPAANGSQLPVVYAYGAASNSATGSAALDFTVQGLTTSQKCVASVSALGTGPAYIKSVASAANKFTVTFDASQSGGTTTVNYVCF